MKSSSKIIVTILAVSVLSAGGYFALQSHAKGETEPLLQSQVTNKAVSVQQGNTSTDQAIQGVLTQINNLDQIKLNTDIFQKPEFLALKDISQDLTPPTDIGRPNPFAPIGTDVGAIPVDGQLATDSSTAGLPTNGLPEIVSAVKTKEVQNIGQKSATLNADVGITTTTNRWFEWGTNQNTVNKTTKQTGTQSQFATILTGLTPKTTYYVKAAVEDNGVVTYGDVVLFKTAE